MKPQPNPGVLSLPSGFRSAFDQPLVTDPVRLSLNENAYGASPAAIAAIAAMATQIHRYPNGAAPELSEAIAEFWGLSPEDIVTSTGSDDLIPVLMRTYMRDGDEAVIFSDSFPKYRVNTVGMECVPIEVARDKDRDFAFEPERLAAALTQRTKIVFLDNPGNPTGVALSAEQLDALHTVLPPSVILALDEAYVEFSDLGNAGIELARRSENVVVFRTLSKAFGLAGLRIGWCTGAPELVTAIRRMRPTFPLTNPAIAAGVAALGDRDHLERVVAAIRRTRRRVVDALRSAGWNIPEPHGNFLLLRSEPSAPMKQEAAVAALNRHGILVRSLVLHDGEPAIRMTVGTDEQMDRVLTALGA